MENQVSVNIMRKQLEDILIVQGEKMETQDLLVLAKYVGKKESLDTKDTYTIITKLFDGV
jgi:hypothetical protein